MTLAQNWRFQTVFAARVGLSGRERESKWP